MLLRAAIDTTFTRRATHPPPTMLPPPPQDWALQYNRLAQEVGAPTDLATGHAEASAFLEPVLSDETTSGSWTPAHQRWLHRDEVAP